MDLSRERKMFRWYVSFEKTSLKLVGRKCLWNGFLTASFTFRWRTFVYSYKTVIKTNIQENRQRHNRTGLWLMGKSNHTV